MMKFNQFGVIDRTDDERIAELMAIKMLAENERQLAPKTLFERFVRRALPEYPTIGTQNDWLRAHLADKASENALAFFSNDTPVTRQIVYNVVVELFDLQEAFIRADYDGYQVLRAVNLPAKQPEAVLTTHDLMVLWYDILTWHTPVGLQFIDVLASRGYFPQDNHYRQFNGKTLPTFATNDLIRETVYVESAVDTDDDGLGDLVRVDVIRPHTSERVPVLFTASPYYQGLNIAANDALLHDVNVPLTRKAPNQVTYDEIAYERVPFEAGKRSVQGKVDKAVQTFTKEQSLPVDISNYFLSRGFAVAYSAGIGTKDADGFQDTGSPEQVESMKNVVEWLAGNRVAFTDQTSRMAVTANWSNQRIAMTGKSYLGTLATAVATTGVAGLETVIAEAAISDWYQYYRDNGLVIAPGGFPGEDMDVLAELVYTPMQQPAIWRQKQASWRAFQANTAKNMDRTTGNYSNYWDARNYLKWVQDIKIDMVAVHGLNDWNVKPRQVYRLWQALQAQGGHHKLFLHQGQHIYINNNRSLDFADQMNLWLTHKLLQVENNAVATLPTITWQDNRIPETWHVMQTWGGGQTKITALSQQPMLVSYVDGLSDELYQKYTTDFSRWRSDMLLPTSKALEHTRARWLMAPLTETRRLNGEVILHLRMTSSESVGLVSAMLVDYGEAKRLKQTPSATSEKIDRGVNFAPVPLMEFMRDNVSSHKMITIGHLNLQNRTAAWQNDDLLPNEWVEVSFGLQPTLYEVAAGHQLGLILYGTDFEMTIRGNQKIAYQIDLAQSSIELPWEE